MAVQFILSVLSGALSVFLVSFVWNFFSGRQVIPTRHRPAASEEDEHIQILVLGDIGRSPRMQYHAISAAKHGRKVDIVAYKETARHPDLIGNPNVTMYALTPQPEWIAWGTLPFFLQIPAKVLHQFWTLFSTLMYATPAAQWIIIQNPPSIPTFHVALLVSLIRGSKLLVDWHNYGHTILAQNPWMKPLVPLYKWYELWLGRYLGNANLAVTDAMARQLRGRQFKLRNTVHTLHDRPAELFQPITSPEERRAFLSRLAETKADAQNIVDGAVRLIVSSTSWTPDEDFGMLLDALVAYANPVPDTTAESPSPILAIITGKGPQQKMYIEKIQQLQEARQLPGIRILTAWLSNRDYASLLACADLGISLHKSSSGVDLPMKVVDMFGAGLPVAAYSAFESIGELVREGENGCGFETTEQLTELLRRLLGLDGQELGALKRGAIQEGSLRWSHEWDRVVWNIISPQQEAAR
ncbi:glycosyl transferases group 1-domain-containing protein [Stachybotrys elegans]|uniref:Chitobiosyldiphosphodolichol beta-mannosyltransferase n=1 Tax=Stachybotrys elegans TaxID=80388 RepID=A0A8K0WWD7_9HYPO|nr:glycosyl transferases group 1-domain-containing protein [Stachybotrys elegans]